MKTKKRDTKVSLNFQRFNQVFVNAVAIKLINKPPNIVSMSVFFEPSYQYTVSNIHNNDSKTNSQTF